MQMLNTYVFACTGANGALIIYFKTGKHFNFFCLFYKNFMSKEKSPFLNNPSPVVQLLPS